MTKHTVPHPARELVNKLRSTKFTQHDSSVGECFHQTFIEVVKVDQIVCVAPPCFAPGVADKVPRVIVVDGEDEVRVRLGRELEPFDSAVDICVETGIR